MRVRVRVRARGKVRVGVGVRVRVQRAPSMPAGFRSTRSRWLSVPPE